MGRFLTRRLLQAALTLIAISIITFLLFVVALPGGNPASMLAGRLATPAEIHLLDIKYGFNNPIWVQYVDTMKNIFDGSAYSYSQGFNVLTELKNDFPATLSLALGAGIFWLLMSLLLGTIAAVKSGKYADRVLTVLSMIGVSMPPFLIGAFLIYYFGYKLSVIPLGGYVPLTQSPASWFWHLIAPWLTLSILFIGFYSRVLRSTILDTMGEDYVRTARAKGLGERKVLVRHILRTSLLPIISLWGLDLGQVIGGGAILTETIYNLHGVGQLAATAIGNFDTMTLMVIVMFTAICVVLLMTITDIIYAALDPRIRLS